MLRFLLLFSLLSVVSLSACPGQTVETIPDAAASMQRDADYANDISQQADAGTNLDAAMADQQSPDSSSGDHISIDLDLSDSNATVDAYVGSEDAGLPPQGENVLVSGSFEHWQNSLPLGWVGDESNVSSEQIAEDDSHAHDGQKSCLFVNASDSHKRLTTAPMTWRAGRYHCFYWARGGGEIRNARYNGDYSSYSSYQHIHSFEWVPFRYDFNLADDVNDVFELIFSVRNTEIAMGHLWIDDVQCTRDIEPCDDVSCENWQICDNDLAACISAEGFCADENECESWQDCDTEHHCVTSSGYCAGTEDCAGASPVCNETTHLCEAGDPCAGVDCGDEWRSCNPDTGSCRLTPGRCLDTEDCQIDLPVCDISSHNCVAIDDASNIVPNGGFEVWSDYGINGSTVTTAHLPEYWYGVCDGCSPYYPDSTQPFDSIFEYSQNTHSGSKALQLIRTGRPAWRFETEPFSLTPTTTYNCAYWVRGQGSHRQRAYCGGWTPDTDFQSIDSDEWQQVSFDINSNSAWCVLIFYVSDTDATRDHVQIDDVSCSQKFSW